MINDIIIRAISLNLLGGSKLDLDMDITATHCNGCMLDLHKLLHADNANFAHDIVGIQNHVDRETGELMNCFLPRFRKKPSCNMSKPTHQAIKQCLEAGKRDNCYTEYYTHIHPLTIANRMQDAQSVDAFIMNSKTIDAYIEANQS